MAHITGGRFKGTPLLMPPRIRATESKVRQALFNILGEFVEGACVLDGFAGSGALGLEALSRGAAFAAFIEAEHGAIQAIRHNLARLSPALPEGSWQVLRAPVAKGFRLLSEAGKRFNLVLLDPPYRTAEGKKALNSLVGCAILAPAGLVAVEHERQAILPQTIGSLLQWKRHRYGDTVLSFYRPFDAGPGPAAGALAQG